MIFAIIWFVGWIILSICDGAYNISKNCDAEEQVTYSFVKLLWPFVIVLILGGGILFCIMYLLNLLIDAPTTLSKKCFEYFRKNKEEK